MWHIYTHTQSSVQSLSPVQLYALQHIKLPCPSPTPGACKPMYIKSVMSPNHLILCRHLLLLPSVFPSIRVFSNESILCIRWPKYWRFSIGPSNEDSGLISFRTDWFDLLAVQGLSKCGYLSIKENPALRDKLLKWEYDVQVISRNL